MAKKKVKLESCSDHADASEASTKHLDAMIEGAENGSGSTPIILPEASIQVVDIRIVGDSPLICHRWSEKARKQMLDKQMQAPSAGKDPKDPVADYLSTLYPFPGGGYGFPSLAFKKSAVSACTSLGKSITKVAARQAFHVVGELVRIEGEPSMREDMVKIGMSTADIRHRGEFKEWATTLRIRFNTRVLSVAQICNLLNTAGFAVGVGEWRPEKDGSYGLFHVG